MAENSILEYRRSPAADLTEEMSKGSSDVLSLREIPFLGQIGLRARLDSDSAGALEGALGMSLPRRVGQVVSDGDRHVLYLSPDEFLFIAPDEAQGGPDPTALADELAEARGALAGQAIDLSANRTVLELRGAAAMTVLEKSCQLDLHPSVFTTGTAVSTLLDAVAIILWRTGEDTYWVMPRSSFTTHVVRWLLDGMREFV